MEAEDLKLSDISDMKQLEYLLRISVMAASISGQGHPAFNNYCFSAYGYLQRMWQVRRSRTSDISDSSSHTHTALHKSNCEAEVLMMTADEISVFLPSH